MTTDQPQLTPKAWLELDTPTRARVAQIFGIHQSKPSHVVSGQVVDSGHAWKDLEGITSSSIKRVLIMSGVDVKMDDFWGLWEQLIKSVRGEPPKSVPGDLVCPKCQRVFTRPQALGSHLKSHDRKA